MFDFHPMYLLEEGKHYTIHAMKEVPEETKKYIKSCSVTYPNHWLHKCNEKDVVIYGPNGYVTVPYDEIIDIH